MAAGAPPGRLDPALRDQVQLVRPVDRFVERQAVQRLIPLLHDRGVASCGPARLGIGHGGQGNQLVADRARFAREKRAVRLGPREGVILGDGLVGGMRGPTL